MTASGWTSSICICSASSEGATPEVKSYSVIIKAEGTDTTFGARPLRRAIQRLLEDPISEQVLEGRWTSGSVIDVDYRDGELVFEAGTGAIPAPRKRDSIAQEAELLLKGYDFSDTSRMLPRRGGGAADGAAS